MSANKNKIRKIRPEGPFGGKNVIQLLDGDEEVSLKTKLTRAGGINIVDEEDAAEQDMNDGNFFDKVKKKLEENIAADREAEKARLKKLR